MPNETLTNEYDELRTIMSSNAFSTGKDDTALLKKLALVMGNDGPNTTHAAALDTLRDRCERGFFTRVFGASKNKEAEAILGLAGESLALNKKAAALKTLRHLRLLQKSGGQSVWTLSIPKKYRAWAVEEFDGASKSTLTTKLNHVKEYHSPKDRRDMAAATRKGLAWALKAAAICTTPGVGAESSDVFIKRWFADEDHESEAKLKELAQKLNTGFKSIAAGASSNKLILTDRPADRGTSWDVDTEAFVYKSERLKVIYCEGDFFGKQNTLTGMTNWARIIVHELSHIQLKTDDVETHGNPRYAWHPRGIGPMKGSFTTAQALNNADNWAWFAADVAGELSKKNRDDALVRPGIT